MVNYKKKILMNTFWLVTAQIVNNIAGYILIVLLARMLGKASLGQYSFIFAFVSLTFLLSDLGLSQLFLREAARSMKKAQFYFNNIFGMKLILVFLSFIFTIILSFLIGKEQQIIHLIWICSIIYFLNNFTNFFATYFNSQNKMKIDAASSIIERILALFLGFYALYYEKSLFLFISFLAISNLAKLVFIFLKLKKEIRIGINFDFSIWKFFLSKSLPFFLTSVFAFIYFKTDTIMLSFIKNDTATGLYNSAYKMIEIISVIPNIIIAASLPSMSRLYVENKKILKELIKRIFRYLFMLALPISIGTSILSKRFMDLIYGPSFSEGSTALQILIWAELFVFLNYLIGNTLNSINKQKYFTITTGICAIINILLNSILIPPFSFIGAGIATVITELINFIILRKYLNLFLVKINIDMPIIKIITAALFMGFVINFIKFLPLFYVVFIGAFIYFAFLLMLRLEKEDLDTILAFKKLLKNKTIK